MASSGTRILAGATRSQIDRAARAQADIYQTHFREFTEGDR